jgi:hypothetical protein
MDGSMEGHCVVHTRLSLSADGHDGRDRESNLPKHHLENLVQLNDFVDTGVWLFV